MEPDAWLPSGKQQPRPEWKTFSVPAGSPLCRLSAGHSSLPLEAAHLCAHPSSFNFLAYTLALHPAGNLIPRDSTASIDTLHRSHCDPLPLYFPGHSLKKVSRPVRVQSRSSSTIPVTNQSLKENWDDQAGIWSLCSHRTALLVCQAWVLGSEATLPLPQTLF